MADIVNEYFKRFYPPAELIAAAEPRRSYYCGTELQVKGFKSTFPQIECADGLTLSVQGHYGSYSSPRDDWADEYTMVEVGFPSERIEELMPYIEGDETTDPTDTVYGYVPVSIVVAVIEKHGGLAGPDHA